MFHLYQIKKYQNEKKTALKYINLAIAELPKIDVFQEERKAILAL